MLERYFLCLAGRNSKNNNNYFTKKISNHEDFYIKPIHRVIEIFIVTQRFELNFFLLSG